MSAPRAALAIFAGLLCAGFTEPPVSPEHTLRYTPERGGACSVMIPYYGPQVLWMGRFAGGRPMDVSAERVFTDWRVGQSCFFTQQECERWVQGSRALFPSGPGYAFCTDLGQVSRRGSGPVKP